MTLARFQLKISSTPTPTTFLQSWPGISFYKKSLFKCNLVEIYSIWPATVISSKLLSHGNDCCACQKHLNSSLIFLLFQKFALLYNNQFYKIHRKLLKVCSCYGTKWRKSRKGINNNTFARQGIALPLLGVEKRSSTWKWRYRWRFRDDINQSCLVM